MWQFNTAQPFKTVNGVSAKGGTLRGPGATVVGGVLFVGSGYGLGGMPGTCCWRSLWSGERDSFRLRKGHWP